MTEPKDKLTAAKVGDPAKPLTSWVEAQMTDGPIKFHCRNCGADMWIGPTGAIRFVKLLLFWSKLHDH